MKKIGLVLSVALLLCLCAFALAEGGVKVEVVKVDGIIVVKLIPEETLLRARGIAEEARPGLYLPPNLTLIEEEAFAGVPAESVEISENVVAIEARAFAECKSLREIIIPATVEKIDDSAFEGCEGVTVYGEKGTEAERIAGLYGFAFNPLNAEPEKPVTPSTPEKPPVTLPFVPADKP